MVSKEGQLKAITRRCAAKRTIRRSAARRVRPPSPNGVAPEVIDLDFSDVTPGPDECIQQPPATQSESGPEKTILPEESPQNAERTKRPYSSRKSGSRVNGRSIFPLVLGFLAGGIAITLLSVFLCTDQYSVETRMLFTTNVTGNGSTHSPATEIRLLNAPAITSVVEQDVFARGQGKGVMKVSEGLAPSASSVILPAQAQNHATLESRLAFRQWLGENLSVGSDIQGETAWVTLALNGSNPEHLKRILESYVSRYAEFRRNLMQRVSDSARQFPDACEPPVQSKEIEAVSSELQKLEFHERNCSLALSFLSDKSSGVFSGFVPDGGLSGIPALSRFQEKIVQLELTKKEMLGKFTPQSREVREIQQQIQGVRSSMRECLEAHLKFLQKGKEQLVAQKTEMERKRGPVASAQRPQGKPCSEAQTESGELLKSQDGLQVFWDGTFTIKKRLLMTPSEAKKIIFTAFDSCFLNATVERGVKEPDWRQVAAAFGTSVPGQATQTTERRWPILLEMDSFTSWLKGTISNATSHLSRSLSLIGRDKASGDN